MIKTIAQTVDGQSLDEFKGRVFFNPITNVYKFEDGSTAIALTLFREVKPYQTASLSTSTKKEYRVWKAT